MQACTLGSSKRGSLAWYSARAPWDSMYLPAVKVCASHAAPVMLSDASQRNAFPPMQTGKPSAETQKPCLLSLSTMVLSCV